MFTETYHSALAGIDNVVKGIRKQLQRSLAHTEAREHQANGTAKAKAGASKDNAGRPHKPAPAAGNAAGAC
jgi:hypothetical protein